jgi:hypothetical protein
MMTGHDRILDIKKKAWRFHRREIGKRGPNRTRDSPGLQPIKIPPEAQNQSVNCKIKVNRGMQKPIIKMGLNSGAVDRT